jgi:hypothetical protein
MTPLAKAAEPAERYEDAVVRGSLVTAPSRLPTRAPRAAPAPRVTRSRCATRSAGQPKAGSALGRCSSGCGGPATACGTRLPRAALRTFRRSRAMRSSPLARDESFDALALRRFHAHPFPSNSARVSAIAPTSSACACGPEQPCLAPLASHREHGFGSSGLRISHAGPCSERSSRT